ncbi:MAG TPA: hypothetical protein VF079_06180 [Sphingomicrobium sp.]
MIVSMLRAVGLLPALAALTACYSDIPKDDPRHAEMLENKAWLDQLKQDDPDTARLLAEQCYGAGGSLWTSEGVLELTRCMRRKYDSGVRA